MNLTLETNGSFLTEEEARFLSAQNIREVGISLDFPDEARYEEFRGLKNSFGRVVRGMELLTKYGVPWEAIMTVTKINRHQIPAVAKLTLGLGGRNLKINICIPMGRAKELEEQGELLTPYECIELAEAIAELEKSYPEKIAMSIPWALPASFENKPFRIARSVCQYKNLLSILPYGEISLCGLGRTHPEVVFGNVRKDGIKDLWMKGMGCLKALRKLTPSHFRGVCNKCMFRKYCANLCPALVYEAYGTFEASYPLCEDLYRCGLFPTKYLVRE